MIYAAVSGLWHLQTNLGFKGADALGGSTGDLQSISSGSACDLSVVLGQHHSFIKSQLLQEVIVP